MCDYDIKHHIDLVEAQISRMSDNSKQMKTWCIALVSGIVGIYMQTGNWFLLWIGFAIIILFAWMDAYYLFIERQFRCVYNDIVGIGNKKDGCEDIEKKEIPPYGMPRKEYKKGFKNHVSPIVSFSIWPIYSVALIAVICLLCCNPKENDNTIQKIQLTGSTINLETAAPMLIREDNSVGFKTDDSINVNVKVNDSLLVKNFNKCVKYVSMPCANRE